MAKTVQMIKKAFKEDWYESFQGQDEQIQNYNDGHDIFDIKGLIHQEFQTVSAKFLCQRAKKIETLVITLPAGYQTIGSCITTTHCNSDFLVPYYLAKARVPSILQFNYWSQYCSLF